MASTAAPYGLRPVAMQGGAHNRGGAVRMVPMTTNVATAFYAGQLLVLGTNGQLTPPAASPTASTTTPVLGVLVGIRYTDPVLGYSLEGTYLPSGAITAGYTNVELLVNDDPLQLYMIQADEAVARSSLGLNFPIVNPQAGSAVTKRSTLALDGGSGASAATNATVRLVDFVRSETSQPGDAFTDCIVRIAPGGVHAYERAAGPA